MSINLVGVNKNKMQDFEYIIADYMLCFLTRTPIFLNFPLNKLYMRISRCEKRNTSSRSRLGELDEKRSLLSL